MSEDSLWTTPSFSSPLMPLGLGRGSLPGWGGVGPVVYCSAPSLAVTKEDLVSFLLATLESAGAITHPQELRPRFRLERGPLGQPLLRLGGKPGPAVSFSEAGGRLYGAVSLTGRVGVDATRPEEFTPPYPLARVFRSGEFNLALRLTENRPRQAAALLWALKEAALKALGVGFHRLAPREVVVGEPEPGPGGRLFPVQADRTVLTWAAPREGGWLAIGLWRPEVSA
ncbi:MAG: 4'-phosphopantetheinyl transferase superfamily protein [Deltaproteobacteria bacterium]|nr:4'-phosphopantetheinyl transferase superfamily protein [Deltaproteobacteria bacterium]